MHDPDDHPDDDPLGAARRARASRPAGLLPTVAVAGVPADPLRAAGWALRGTVSEDPFVDGRRLAPTEALEHPGLDAVAVDGADPAVAGWLADARRAGLLVLLAGPAPLDLDALLALHAVDDAPPVVVALAQRWAPWARAVTAALPLAGPPLQLTVRGMPTGAGPAAELVDLVRTWCGEVALAGAAPAPLPATELPADGERPAAAVDWALLTGGGTTVLVSSGGGPLQVRLSTATARLEAGPDGVRWTGGAALPLPPPVDPVEACARALREAVGGGDLPPDDPVPAAGLDDLLAAASVLAALRDSARAATLVPVG